MTSPKKPTKQLGKRISSVTNSSRGLGNPFSPIITPLPPGQDPSSAQMELRISGFRRRIGRWSGIYRDHIIHILRSQAWDLDAAVVAWEAELEDIRACHAQNTASQTPSADSNHRLLAATSLHQNHRLAIDQLCQNIGKLNSVNLTSNLTPIRLSLLLNDNDWDLRAAEKSLTGALEEGDSWQKTVKRRERRLRMNAPDQPFPNECHKAERLATFLEIAGTYDWVSARDFLGSQGWDLAVAIEVWLRQGFATTTPSRIERERSSYRESNLPHDESDNLWPDIRPTAGPVTDVDTDDNEDASCDYGQGEYEDRNGWMVNLDPEVARAGINVPSKLTHFGIQGLKGRTWEWSGPKKEGTGRKPKGQATIPAIPEDFDITNTDHISQLNKWANQPPRRVVGVKKKAASQAYHPDEVDWLYKWHVRKYEEALTADPKVLSNGKEVSWDLGGMHKAFNKAFAGKPLDDARGTKRQARTQQSFDMKRRRTKKICKEFGLKESLPHKSFGQTVESTKHDVDNSAEEASEEEASETAEKESE